MHLSWVDWLIMLVYFVFVLGIGFALKRYMRTSNDFFLAGRSMPAWVCGLAFISANLGAQEVIGMGASGAKYGIATSHFYWIGAIPAELVRPADVVRPQVCRHRSLASDHVSLLFIVHSSFCRHPAAFRMLA